MRKLYHPASGRVVNVRGLPNYLGVALLGPLWLALRGAWQAAFVLFIVNLAVGVVTFGIGALAVNLIAGFWATRMIASARYKEGYVHVSADEIKAARS